MSSDGTKGDTHIAFDYGSACTIYRALLLADEQLVVSCCRRCALTAERLNRLIVALQDYFQMCATHPEYWTTEGSKRPTFHVQPPMTDLDKE